MIKNDEGLVDSRMIRYFETSSEPMISKHEKFASSTKSASLVTFTAAQGFPLSTHRRSTQGLSFLGFGFGFSPTSTAGTPPLCAPFFILSSLKGQKSSGDIIHQGANQWNITPKEFRNNMRSKLQSSFLLRKCLCLSISITWHVYNYIYSSINCIFISCPFCELFELRSRKSVRNSAQVGPPSAAGDSAVEEASHNFSADWDPEIS